MKALRPVLAVGFLTLLAGPALAQERYAAIEVRGGYTMLQGDAGKALKGQSSFGGGVKVALSDRLHVGLTIDFAHHSALYEQDDQGELVQPLEPCATKPCRAIGGPTDEQWNLTHTFLKLSFDAVNSGKLTLTLNGGPGMVMFSPNQVLRDKTGIKTDTHLAFNVGASGTYWFTDRIGFMVSPQLDIAMKKTTGQIFSEKSAMMLPLTAGFNFKI